MNMSESGLPPTPYPFKYLDESAINPGVVNDPLATLGDLLDEFMHGLLNKTLAEYNKAEAAMNNQQANAVREYRFINCLEMVALVINVACLVLTVIFCRKVVRFIFT